MEKCAVCAKRGDASKIRRCSRCLTTRYCSRDCQARDWPRHKAACTEKPVDDSPKSGQSKPTDAKKSTHTSAQAAANVFTSLFDGAFYRDPWQEARSRAEKAFPGYSLTDDLSSDLDLTEEEVHVPFVSFMPPGWPFMPPGAPYMPPGTSFMPPGAPFVPPGVLSTSPGTPSLSSYFPFMQPRAPFTSPGMPSIEAGAPFTSAGGPFTPFPPASTPSTLPEIHMGFSRKVLLLRLLRPMRVPYVQYAWLVKDHQENQISVWSEIKGSPEPYFQFEDLREGHFLCVKRARIHNIVDLQIRIIVLDDPSSARIFKINN